jgi:hypothetical protein
MVFDGLSNDNELYEIWMTIDLKVEEHIYKKILFLRIFLYFLEHIHCQGYQNYPLSTDPFSLIIMKITHIGHQQSSIQFCTGCQFWSIKISVATFNAF